MDVKLKENRLHLHKQSAEHSQQVKICLECWREDLNTLIKLKEVYAETDAHTAIKRTKAIYTTVIRLK